MHADEQKPGDPESGGQGEGDVQAVKPLNPVQRRILGVLIEKARTTPDAYPLSLNGLVTGCNQKSNRSPLMQLTPEEVEDELIALRERGVVAEVHGGGRVPKYRHYAYDHLGVKGVEVGVLTELLLRGEQSIGDLRSRASRFEAIADVNQLMEILKSLEERGLVVALTPPGRGQIYTHNLYDPDELKEIRARVEAGEISAPVSRRATSAGATASEIEGLKGQIAELKELVAGLAARVERLEG